MDNWLAPYDAKIPDFIICGAMKSGTTTLHAILNKHPDIFIPEKEIHFFDMDDIIQHPDFSSFNDNKWINHDINEEPEKYWQWYSSNFEAAQKHQIIGEDSTTYIASKLAAKRIAAQKKDIKVLVMLRHPTARAYSQYWHLVRTDRAKYSFEKTLEFNPYSILNRSLYTDQIRELLAHIPKEQVKFIIFEEFLSNKEQCIDDVCQFLGVDSKNLPEGVLNLHENSAMLPKYPNLQVIKNRVFPAAGNISYANHFSINQNVSIRKKLTFSKVINKLHRLINPLNRLKSAKIKPTTKMFLDEYFTKELDGLNELLEKDILSFWFKNNIS